MNELYPAAIWVPAHASNFRKAGRDSFSRIVIHCTDGRPDPRAVAQMWQARDHKSSAHFVCGQEGLIIQSVSLADVAWHAHAMNALSVGIEHCARSPREWGSSDPGLPPSEPQLAASARLCAWLCQEAGLEPTRENILGHAECDIATTHADCPTGCGLNLDDYVARVAAIVGAPFA